jgi:multidrug resistance protein, MATE family
MSVAPSIRAEFRATTAVALPLAAANLAQMAMGLTDTIMVGRLGALPLAAAGLGAALYFTTATAVQGIVNAVAPLAAHALGAGDRARAGRITGEGLVLGLLLSLPFMGVMALADRFLVLLGYDPAVAAEVGRFLHALMLGAPAFIAFSALRSLLSALERTRAIMVVLLFCILSNALLNWVLIYGHFGLPALGIVGSGLASAINQWLMPIGLLLYIRLAPSLASLDVLGGMRPRQWRDMTELLRLGLPIAGIITLENGVFLAAGLMVGLFGAAALGAHHVVLNCAATSFMIPLGVSQAATVRVAFELGAGRPAAARLAGFVALGLGMSVMVAAAIVMWLVPNTILAAFVDVRAPANADLVAIAVQLFALAALFQVSDGMQTVAAGALRGYRDATVPMLLAAIGYWAIGFLGGWLLAFPLGHGPTGMWWGLVFGTTVVAGLLTLRLWRLGMRDLWKAVC